MTVEATGIPGALLVVPERHEDRRGFFMELWRQERYRDAGLPAAFAQDNLSFSEKGVLRGLHYQHPQAQGKLVSAVQGEVFDVAVDLRPGSPTFQQWTGRRLSAQNQRQLYVPEGCAHGFLALRPALVHYKCTAPYAPESDRTLAHDDPAFGIGWPLHDLDDAPVLSEKDAAAPRYDDAPAGTLPGRDA